MPFKLQIHRQQHAPQLPLSRPKNNVSAIRCATGNIPLQNPYRHVACSATRPLPSSSSPSTTPVPPSTSALAAAPQTLDAAPLARWVPAAITLAIVAAAGPAAAFELHAEPSNALSLPTWAVHTSSVIEWVTAMGLMWQYAEVTGNERWKGMTWGMMPCLGSAMCACTWHVFYNTPALEFLVVLQAFLTVVGNATCWIAAYRIYEAAQAEKA